MSKSICTCGVAAIITILLVQHHLLINGQYVGPSSRDHPRGTPVRVPLVVRGDQPPPPETAPKVENTEEIHPLTAAHWQTNRRRGYSPTKLHPCEQSSCYPATGNLLIGREDQLSASSTCGLDGQQRFCIVSHLEDPKKCFWCDSRPVTANNPTKNHQVSNIVYRMFPGTRQKSWWQSENGKENVTIQLNLEAEFHFTHLIIVFKTFRPAAMLIERSYDFGKTWQVYRYFAHKCGESFPGIPERNPENLTDVVCEYRYSSVEPSTGGECIFRVLPPTVHIDNPYSEEVQNLLKMTNLRINFTKLHTLGDDLLDNREEIQEKYYYAISDMVVRGSCSCYGHANRCLPLPDIAPKPDMVHGRCECTHNTKGRNCEECEDFFNDLPWRPAIGKKTNACKRCNCNNHATSCHFDAAVYESNGRVSGGVCDGCKHNTIGASCEQCKPYFYRDPQRDIQDPEICRPCDCDPHGALDNGICDSLTDTANSLQAGSCHCKTNVDGRRCDICKNGYWNFTAENPVGCQPCSCNIQGTIDNQGCDVYTGECICKRYVTGRDCNQCLPEYFGLSEEHDGCKPCDCDLGGSLDNNCDVLTGKCRCREHLQGRTCNQPKQQHFTPSLDFLLYEAELARGSATSQVFIREPYRDGRDNTWTGVGFMKAFEGSTVEFTIDDIKTPMEYEIVMRYEPVLPGNWEEATVTLVRPDPVDPEGPCRDSTPESDVSVVTLYDYSRSVPVFPPVCLEPHKTYQIRIDFKRYNPSQETPQASVLLDSIVLVPRIEKLPFFRDSVPADHRRKEYNIYQCGQVYHTPNQSQVPDVCKKYHNSIGFYVFNGAYSCQCNPTGSTSKLCNDYGGGCSCKPNVVGRRCDRCAPGTYGFGPEGCKTCDCNSIGSLDNFCDSQTGQCKCRLNTYGRECDECRPGFWNFPNCERCECNGHADKCESRTGTCISCRDNTQGHACDTCVDGHYGDPRISIDIPCRPCPCPGVAGSGHSYADRCYLDPVSKDVICECQEGYSGWSCDVCNDNYYGNPEEPGGSCNPCNCSNKIDITTPGNCDPHSGECKLCLENTVGFHCENCKDGFYRLDPEDTCIECVCNILGSNQTAAKCDKGTGQCICHPNVIGVKCDSCAENHWKIASGNGCEFCDCDPVGSESQQCDEYYGDCKCRPGFGGRQCNQCKTNHWGNPRESKCYQCECDYYGSETQQCDQSSGACVCKPGIGGYKCDNCARGYLGEAPRCSPCGECFDNWNRTFNEHKERTLAEIERAKNMKKVGATGAYTKEFDEMQKDLDDIELLLSSSINTHDLDAIDKQIKDLRDQLSAVEKGPLIELDDLYNNATTDIKVAEYQLLELHNSKEKLANDTKDLEADATLLQEANVEGALNLIHMAKDRAIKAAHEAERTQQVLRYADLQCKATENLLNKTIKDYQDMQENNKNALQEIKENLKDLHGEIPDLNELICDRRGDPCDSVCGGAGCGNCGNLVACDKGARKQAETAYLLANSTEVELRDKEDKANELIRNVSSLDTGAARTLSQAAFDKAQEALFNSTNTLGAHINVTEQLREFLNQNKSTPAEVRKLAEEVLLKKIQLEPGQITDLANKIQTVVNSLTNIDAIIDATKADLERVNNLKDYANKTKEDALGIYKKTEKVEGQLMKTNASQEEAREKLNKAWVDMPTKKNNTLEISRIIDQAQNQSDYTTAEVKNLLSRLTDLQQKVVANNVQEGVVRNKALEVEKDAESTRKKAEKLSSEYKRVNDTLAKKLKTSEATHDRARGLLNRASKLIGDTERKKISLSSSQKPPETLLETLENEINDLNSQMDKYIGIITDRTKFYNDCI